MAHESPPRSRKRNQSLADADYGIRETEDSLVQGSGWTGGLWCNQRIKAVGCNTTNR